MKTGYAHGYLIVLGRADPPVNRHGQPLYAIRCSACGMVKPMRSDHVQRLFSCGCVRNRLSGESNTKHGNASKYRCTPEYKAWQEAKNRCFNPRNKRYSRYGGCGITMFPAWVGDFGAFLRYIGPRPVQPLGKREFSLDRIDNDGNYEPGNVRWDTAKEQARVFRKAS
jgi:hypothetical protein